MTKGRTTNETDQAGAHAFGRSSFVIRPFVDGENVLLAPPWDAPALVAAIERLACDSGLRERLAGGGRALAAQFGWDAIAAQHEQLYERLVGADLRRHVTWPFGGSSNPTRLCVLNRLGGVWVARSCRISGCRLGWGWGWRSHPAISG